MGLTILEEDSGSDDWGTSCPSVVVMYSDGKTYRLPYFVGETLLETARRGRLHINTGCEKGNCGACLVNIISGRVRMRANSVLTDEDLASGIALACQSVPISKDIEIDLS